MTESKKTKWPQVLLGLLIIAAGLSGVISGRAYVRSEAIEGTNVRLASALVCIVGITLVVSVWRKK